MSRKCLTLHLPAEAAGAEKICAAPARSVVHQELGHANAGTSARALFMWVLYVWRQGIHFSVIRRLGRPAPKPCPLSTRCARIASQKDTKP